MRYLEELVKAMHGLSGLRDSSCFGGKKREPLVCQQESGKKRFPLVSKKVSLHGCTAKSTTVKNYSFFH